MRTSETVEALEVRLLLEAVHSHYGYDLRHYAQPSLYRRLSMVLATEGASSFGDLQHRILVDAECFARVLEGLTVQVSAFFRDPNFFAAFRAHVVPVLRTYPRINLWHAGCAGGEEVYAMAILLAEEGLLERSQLYGTDLSGRAIDRAKEGVYSEIHLEQTAENYRRAGGTAAFSDYYRAAYGRFAVRDTLKKNVVFFQHNLESDHRPGDMQVIVCRNVLIYFDAILKARVLGAMLDGLCHGGFLCLGPAETLPQELTSALGPVRADERIFRRRSEP